MNREFSVVIEKDGDGYFVASVPTLRGCHQGCYEKGARDPSRRTWKEPGNGY